MKESESCNVKIPIFLHLIKILILLNKYYKILLLGNRHAGIQHDNAEIEVAFQKSFVISYVIKCLQAFCLNTSNKVIHLLLLNYK